VSSEGISIISDHRFVHVTPAPILSRLERLDNRMATFVEMLPGVPQRRGIAAAYVTAGEAQAQVYPTRADSQAILAAFGTRRYIANHFQMRINHLVPIPFMPEACAMIRQLTQLLVAKTPRSAGRSAPTAVFRIICVPMSSRILIEKAAAGVKVLIIPWGRLNVFVSRQALRIGDHLCGRGRTTGLDGTVRKTLRGVIIRS
jgi:hypothetical protein